MIVDASALLAIVQGEPDGQAIAALLSNSTEERRISPVNVWEVSTKLNRAGAPDAVRATRDLLLSFAIVSEDVDTKQMHAAMSAQTRYGKKNHPANLNLADCFAYALAVTRGEPLLYKGDDFSKTDVRQAR